ncbi:ATP-grasp domain-containing protein [Streptomyces sp. NBC_01716]|uniref:ATP-grasp domain-containing protein n=1 Tax=Streptomyces sp. NBC_01716 TaxID=2975917 RepID=UPI002E314C8D|nr:ATP-grasp domain-containing protein [Streptomyces sp. NBC_01716]
MSELIDDYRMLAGAVDILRRYWGGRQVILLANHFTHSTQLLIDEVTACGATLVGVVTRPRRAPEPRVPTWSCAERGIDLAPHEFEPFLGSPPDMLREWLDDIDPARSCVVLGSIWTTMSHLCGRPVHGWRRPEWVAWEDKVRIERLWADLGIPSPRHVVMSVDDPGLREQATALDGGRGVVMAIDSSQGVPGGGGRGLRWVRSSAEFDAALKLFTGRTRQVRIAEFVEGVPCSTQALALDTGIAVFEPAEEAMLRDPRFGEFRYCGTSTSWRPPDQVKAAIETYARDAGRRLDELTGYRGIFTVDGLLTDRGFLATELNPRGAGGLGFRPGWPEFPTYLFHRAVQENVPGIVDLPPESVQATFRDVIARHPSFSGTIPLGTGPVAADVVRPGTDTRAYTTKPSGATVRYRVGGQTVRVIDVAPSSADGTVGSVIAEFVGLLGHPGLVSFSDDSVRSTLTSADRATDGIRTARTRGAR